MKSVFGWASMMELENDVHIALTNGRLCGEKRSDCG